MSSTSFIVPSLIGTKVPYAPVIHDLIAFKCCIPHDKKAQRLERLLLKRMLRHAAHIFCVSAATKHDLLECHSWLKEDQVTVTQAGPLEASPPLAEPDEQTILCPGTLCPRKNQLRLIHAYDHLPADLKQQWRLVLLGGRGWHDDDIVTAAEVTEGVEWRDYVPDEEYKRIMSTATVLAWPSLYEGFGLPLLDAMQRGIPILTSRRGSLQEVAGDAAVYVEPVVQCDIDQGLETILRDADLRQQLRDKGLEQAKEFSWEKTAQILVQAINV